ncbi:choline transporter-like protein 4 isoform X1 [Acropora muricata]|uniref:choline transporter-like protein 4 isoform X1 n=1 Tax=Acropora muricata TaxID=159855 RepID=UPI0034E49912
MASQMNENKVGDNSEVENLSLLQKGERRKYDPNFRGPIADRSCTDIICCLLFVAYIVGMIVVGVIAFKEGDPDRLLSPTDSNGNTCGKGDYKDKKFLLFFDISTCVTKGGSLAEFVSFPSCPTPQVCVSSCPKENQLGTSPEPSDMVCKEGVGEVTKDNKFEFVRQGKCAPYYLASSAVLYRCIPTLVGTLLANGTAVQNRDGQNVTKGAVEGGIKGLQFLLNAQNFGRSVFEDIKAVWYWLLIGMILTLVLGFIYIVITRWITGLLVWLSILLVFALLIAGMYCCYSKYKFLQDSGTSQDFQLKFTFDLDVYKNSKETWLVLGIFLAVVFVILFLIVLVLRKRIVLAVKVIKEASKAVGEIKTSLFFPIVTWLLQLVLFAWFLAVAVYLVTNGTPVFKVIDALKVDPYNLTNGTDCNPKTFENQFPNTSASCVMAGLEENVHLLRMQIFHLFGWFWIMNFIIALGQCVLAGAFASWYFTYQKPDDIPALPIISSFWRTLRYHTGSLAFGAAIIAIVQLIRAILEYIDAKLKEYGQDNKVIKFILCCCKCCFWCLEKILKFLNKNAYIVIAIHGKNFCSSAREAFKLLLENVLRVAAINSVTTFLLFMGKLVVVGIVGVASFFWFGQLNKDDPTTLQFSVVPTILMVIFAYAVSVLFFDVYDMAIDTVFLCVMIDLDMNDGSAEKPYFMSDSLKKLLDVENRSHPDGTEKEAK